MTKQQGKYLQWTRAGCQIIFTLLFFILLITTGGARAKSFGFSDTFFYIDPLIALTYFVVTFKLLPILLFSFIPVMLSFVFGRFFCGWVCPLGAITQFFTWAFGPDKKKKVPVRKGLLRIKAIVLILLLVFAIFGTQLIGWLDPFSLLTRSTSITVLPGFNFLLQRSVETGAKDEGIVSKAVKPLYKFSRDNLLTRKQRHFHLSILTGLIFFAIVFLNFCRRRFFCNYVCPLGALYGIIGRFSLLNLKPNQKCTSCKACANHCPYYGSPFEDYYKSECMVCFNCVKDCPVDAISVSLELPGKKNRPAVDIGRRRAIGTIASGLFLTSLPQIAGKRKPPFHGFIRPPGAISEKEFLKKCIRCGECMQACPTTALQPALFQTGLEGIWTPLLVPVNGYCEYECYRCTQVCPTEAIERLTLDEKKKFKIGTAVVDRNTCYTYADGFNCAVCEEHCPVPDKAIRFREVEVWTFKGILKKVKQIYVVPDLCTGCGICENVCPRSDKPAIYVGAEGEVREKEDEYGIEF